MKGSRGSIAQTIQRPRRLKRATHLATVFAVVLNRRAAAALLSPLIHDSADHILSTFRRQARILVRVHSVLRESLSLATSAFPVRTEWTTS